MFSKKKSKKVTSPQVPAQPIAFHIDPRLEAVKQLPGGHELFQMIHARAVVTNAKMDIGLKALLKKYGLPNDIDGLKQSGYEIVINVPAVHPDEPQTRELILYKKVDTEVVYL